MGANGSINSNRFRFNYKEEIRMKIFVFGSNLAGRHGKGAALWAKQYRGAIYGQGEGLQGQSYGIPTKDERLRPRSLVEIAEGINTFKEFARKHSELEFEVTPIGCGYAGYLRSEILPFLLDLPPNCELTKEWNE